MNFFKKISNLILESVGFESWSDLVLDTFAFRIKYIGLYFIGFFVTVFNYILETLSKHHKFLEIMVSDYIYNPPRAVELLFVITIANVVLGFSRARKFGQSADGEKFMKAFVRFTLQVVFIYFLFTLHKLYPEVVHVYMVHTLMIAFILSTFWSAWNNAYDLGFINEDVHEMIVNVLDIRKILPILKNFGDKSKNSKDKLDQSGN